jgi:hypothetical protein
MPASLSAAAATPTYSAGRGRKPFTVDVAAVEIVQRLGQLLRSLPPRAPLRAAIVTSIVNGDTNVLEQLEMLGIPESNYYYWANTAQNRGGAIKSLPGPSHPAPRKTEEAEVIAVWFWLDVTVQSNSVDVHGERSEIRWCWHDYEAVFSLYKAFLLMEHGFDESPPDDEWPESLDPKLYLRRSAFLAARPACVKKGQVRECSCPICRDLGKDKARLDQARSEHRAECASGAACQCDAERCAAWDLYVKENELDIAALRTAAADFAAHLDIVRMQRAEFERQRANLGKPGEPNVIVQIDFSPFRLCYRRKISLTEGMEHCQALVAVLYTPNAAYDRSKPDSRKNRPYSWHVFDFFAPESNDAVFLRRALLDLFRENWCQPGLYVSVWSDGGPKHFKTCKSLLFVLHQIKEMARLDRVVWNFFGSHHGKGMCDSHCANAKRRLKKVALVGDDVEGVSAIAEVVGQLRGTTAK